MLEALRRRLNPDLIFKKPRQVSPKIVGETLESTPICEAEKTILREASRRELSPEAYLASLSEQDRENVLQFVDFAKTLKDKYPGTRFGVIAIGSTTVSEEKRHHSPEDIDLRILNSKKPGTSEYTKVMEEIRGSIKNYLRAKRTEFEEDDCTVETRMVEGYSGGKKELMQWADWYNTNPSFVIKSQEGLPLHISISGQDAWSLDRHLEEERKQGGSFSILMQDKKA